MTWRQIRALAKRAMAVFGAEDSVEWHDCCEQLCGALGMRLQDVKHMNDTDRRRYIPEAPLKSRFHTFFQVSITSHYNQCTASCSL